ncbi:MAG: hypothetical protein AB1482_12010 [Pseudomonadota bacterium]
MNPVASIILTAVDKTRAAFNTVTGGIKSLKESALGLRSILAGLGVGLSLAGLVGQVKRAAEEMDAARKSAQAAGTTVEKFSALSYVAGQSGVDNLAGSLAKLASTLDDARNRTGPAAAAFQKLRIDPAQFSDSSDALLAIADRFAQLPDGVGKTSLAIDLFGQKLGPKLIPMLNQGSAAMRAQMDVAEQLGLVMSDKATAAAEKFNDSLDKLSKRASGVGVKLANEALPSLNQFVSALDDVIERGSTLDKIKFFGAGYISEETLNRISDAGERVQDYNAKIFELQQQLLELRRVEHPDSPNIRIWEERIAALEKTRAGLIERARQADSARAQSASEAGDEIGEAYEAEARDFKKSVESKIRDAEGLQRALQSAFSQALAEEKQYTDEARRLRTRASITAATSGDQASLAADAAIAAIKLQRLKETAGPDEIREQADAVRELANALDDQGARARLVADANAADIVAAEKSAQVARERARELALQMRDNEKRVDGFSKTLEAVDKPVALDIVPSAQTDASLDKLREAKRLIEFINATPAKVNFGATGYPGDALRTAAAQYGRRQ